MDYKTFLDSIKKRSKYETWGGKTQLPSTRFHHLVSPAAKPLGNFRIASSSRYTRAYPVLDWEYWELSQGGKDNITCVINIIEYPSIDEAHEYLLERLASLTAPRIDYSPKRNTPGDVLILSDMARDNLLIRMGQLQPINEGESIRLFQQIDDWLLGNWPLMSSKEKTGGTPSLKVSIRTKSPSVRAGEPLELVVEVRKKDTVLDLKTLPHRFLANPGRISWKNNSYLFTSDRRGMSEITLDVMGPEGEYGQGSLKLQVMGK